MNRVDYEQNHQKMLDLIVETVLNVNPHIPEKKKRSYKVKQRLISLRFLDLFLHIIPSIIVLLTFINPFQYALNAIFYKMMRFQQTNLIYRITRH